MIGVLRSGEAADTEPTEGTEALEVSRAISRKRAWRARFTTIATIGRCVPAFVDVALYGIAREATTNIVRHAQAVNAWIMLWTDVAGPEGTARLVVTRRRPRGLGVATRAASGEPCRRRRRGEGHGIEGHGQRARVLQGASRGGRSGRGGFEVSVSIPFEVKEARV